MEVEMIGFKRIDQGEVSPRKFFIAGIVTVLAFTSFATVTVVGKNTVAKTVPLPTSFPCDVKPLARAWCAKFVPLPVRRPERKKPSLPPVKSDKAMHEGGTLNPIDICSEPHSFGSRKKIPDWCPYGGQDV
jgi:hypothetical protein